MLWMGSKWTWEAVEPNNETFIKHEDSIKFLIFLNVWVFVGKKTKYPGKLQHFHHIHTDSECVKSMYVQIVNFIM